MLGKNKFKHDLPRILKHRIGVLRDGLKVGGHAGAAVLDVPRYRLEIVGDGPS